MTDKITPAFSTAVVFKDQIVYEPGMTMRDYFAAKAMHASRSRNSEYKTWDDLAQDAYDIADAMLKAREA